MNAELSQNFSFFFYFTILQFEFVFQRPSSLACNMSDNVEDIFSLVTVTDIEKKDYVAGVYKEVGVKVETGYWSHGFTVNMFPNMDHFDDIAVNDRLTMQVNGYHFFFTFSLHL